MKSKTEVVSVLLDRNIYKSRSQVKRAIVQRGLTFQNGIMEQTNYWRVPQSTEPMVDDSFETGRKVQGVRTVRAKKQ